MQSTVPKVQYAKLRNKSKKKQQNRNIQNKDEVCNSSDLFSHMNKDNLNYIKKQLKNKKKQAIHHQNNNNFSSKFQSILHSSQEQKTIKDLNKEQIISNNSHNVIERLKQQQLITSENKEIISEQEESNSNNNYNYNINFHKNNKIIPSNSKLKSKQSDCSIQIQNNFELTESHHLKQIKSSGDKFILFLENYIEGLGQSDKKQNAQSKDKSNIQDNKNQHHQSQVTLYQNKNLQNNYKVYKKDNQCFEQQSKNPKNSNSKSARQKQKSMKNNKKKQNYEKNHNQIKQQSYKYANKNYPLNEQELKQEKLAGMLLAHQLQRYRRNQKEQQIEINQLQFNIKSLNIQIKEIKDEFRIITQQNQILISGMKNMQKQQNNFKQYFQQHQKQQCKLKKSEQQYEQKQKQKQKQRKKQQKYKHQKYKQQQLSKQHQFFKQQQLYKSKKENEYSQQYSSRQKQLRLRGNSMNQEFQYPISHEKISAHLYHQENNYKDYSRSLFDIQSQYQQFMESSNKTYFQEN